MKRLRLFASLVPLLAVTQPSRAEIPVTPRIVGGSTAPVDTYDWMAALASTSDGTLFTRQSCGASLISPEWVLTAAHCVEGKSANSLQIVVGLTDLDDTAGAEVRGVKGVYIHPNYDELDSGDLNNDIALLLLDNPVTTITPVAFAQSTFTAPPGTLLRALGWGDTQSTPRYPTLLHMVDLGFVPISVANRSYEGFLDKRHLAAKSPNRDTCQGDSGGPLFNASGGGPGVPLLVGITSFGRGCANSEYPGIYTNVGTYAPWMAPFLGHPTAGEPQISVIARGRPLPHGTNSTSRRFGTDFGKRLRGGRTAVRSFTVTNPVTSYPLSVTNVTVSNGRFEIRQAPTAVFSGSASQIRIRFRAPRDYRSKIVRSDLKIESNASNFPLYRFKLIARYRKSR